MVIKKHQTTLESFAKGKISDYPMGDAPIGISFQEHDGRVPEKGWGINSICFEAYYVIAGSAQVFIDDENYTVEEGDVVILKPGNKSYLVAHHLKLLTITMPNWYQDQYQEVDTQ